MFAVEQSEAVAGWAAVAPMMAAYHERMAARRDAEQTQDNTVKPVEKTVDATANQSPSSEVNASGLTPEQQAQVDALKARDREVRDHEQAHARVGGQYAGEPTYSYQAGPDGQRYAVGGEVAIDVSPVPDDPAATVDKMEVVKAAALAPAEPSSADRRVAALADATRNQALADLAAVRQAELSGQVDMKV